MPILYSVSIYLGTSSVTKASVSVSFDLFWLWAAVTSCGPAVSHSAIEGYRFGLMIEDFTTFLWQMWAVLWDSPITLESTSEVSSLQLCRKLKGILHIKGRLQVLRTPAACVGKKSCIKPYLALFSLFLGRLPQLMSLESASAGAEDCKFETETFFLVLELQRSELTWHL